MKLKKKWDELTEEKKKRIGIGCLVLLGFAAGVGTTYGFSKLTWNLSNKKYPERGISVGWNPGDDQMTVYWGLCGANDKIKRKYVDSFILSPDTLIKNGQEMINAANECKVAIGQKQFNEAINDAVKEV